MQEELENNNTVVCKHALEGVNVVEALPDYLRGDQLVDPRGEHVLIMGAVKNADHTSGRNRCMYTPQEVMARLGIRGNLEGGNITTLWVDAGKDVADGAILATGVHSLKHNQQGALLARVENVLHGGESISVFHENRCRRFFGFKAAIFICG